MVFNFQSGNGGGIGIPNVIQSHQSTAMAQGNLPVANKKLETSIENQFGRLSIISNESNFSNGGVRECIYPGNSPMTFQ